MLERFKRFERFTTACWNARVTVKKITIYNINIYYYFIVNYACVLAGSAKALKALFIVLLFVF